MKPAVDISDLSKRFGDIQALDHINLQVYEGELFGLIGPDGAGKTTVFRIMTSLLEPDSGTVFLKGYDTVRDTTILRQHIGYMPERFSLYPYLTVRENLSFFASIYGVSVKDNYSLIAPIFSQLEKFPDRKAGNLSGGMKQKLALSCALIHRPDILLLDEPTTGVDAVSRSEFWDMLESLRKEGITIVVSTSYMDEATRCGRIAIMDRGRIMSVGTPGELAADLDENLYDAVAGDMFGLLAALRSLSEVENCYTFGATLRVVGGKDFDPQKVIAILEEKGFRDARITPAKGTIEDLFIKLAQNDE